MIRSVEERLAILETQNIAQSKDIGEVLDEVKNISAFILEYKGTVDILADACLPTRVTKIETREKVYVSIGAACWTAVLVVAGYIWL